MRTYTIAVKVLLLGATFAILPACSGQAPSPASGAERTTVAALSASESRDGAVPVVAAHTAAALASLDALAQLVAKESPQRRGFQSTEEVKLAKPGVGFHMFRVGPDDLRGYKAGDDVQRLLTDMQRVMVPLTVNGEVRTAVVVRQEANGEWKPVEFGHIHVVKGLDIGRRSVVSSRGASEDEVSLVQVPWLSNAMLLAHREGGVLMMTPTSDVPGTNLHRGEAHRADEVFAALQPLAPKA